MRVSPLNWFWPKKTPPHPTTTTVWVYYSKRRNSVRILISKRFIDIYDKTNIFIEIYRQILFETYVSLYELCFTLILLICVERQYKIGHLIFSHTVLLHRTFNRIELSPIFRLILFRRTFKILRSKWPIKIRQDRVIPVKFSFWTFPSNYVELPKSSKAKE